jgi:hypothetical protein
VRSALAHQCEMRAGPCARRSASQGCACLVGCDGTPFVCDSCVGGGERGARALGERANAERYGLLCTGRNARDRECWRDGGTYGQVYRREADYTGGYWCLYYFLTECLISVGA